MTNRVRNRTSDICARLLATLGMALGFTVAVADAAPPLVGGILVQTTCTDPPLGAGPIGQGLDPAPPFGLSGSLTAPPCVGTDFLGPFTGSADVTSFVDFGVMKTIGHASGSGGSGYGGSSTHLIFRDMVTVNAGDPVLVGQMATVNAQMQLQALLAFANWDLVVTGVPAMSSSDFNCSSPCTFDLTLGMPFGTQFLLEVDLQADDFAFAPCCSTASFDLSASVYWGGIQSVTFGGEPVPFTITSISGHDWTQSSVPGIASVPEPGSLALLALGLAGLGFARGSRHPRRSASRRQSEPARDVCSL
jgi:PEP-CTERM motif